MVLVVSIVLAVIAAYLYFKFFPNVIVDISCLGKWAVVTGATDGIGKAFAHELAGRGYSIVLVSRSIDKLSKCAKEIEDKFQVSTKIIQADFMSLDSQMYSRINDVLKDLEIGILVNNVGTTTPHPDYFLDLEKNHSDLFQGIVNCNITSAINMTRFVMPGMINRGKGMILNISSQLSKLPAPLHTLYGASKSFLTKFSQDLNTEYNEKGIHVHVLNTGLVTTKLSGVKKSSFYASSPDAYVKSALKEVTRKQSCDGYIGHSIFSSIVGALMFLFPNWVGDKFKMYLIKARRLQINRCKKCKLQCA